MAQQREQMSGGAREGLHITPGHLLLGGATNLGPLISRWEINKFENF
jgi:hypothetical protein